MKVWTDGQIADSGISLKCVGDGSNADNYDVQDRSLWVVMSTTVCTMYDTATDISICFHLAVENNDFADAGD